MSNATSSSSTTTQQTSPANTALQAINQATQAVAQVGNNNTTSQQSASAGSYPGIRGAIYQLIQAQSPDKSEGAIIGEVQCPIHLGLIGTADNQSINQKEPVTISCGHTFCRGCISIVYTTNAQRRCPTCRAPMTANPTTLPTNIMINSIVSRLRPQQGGRRRRKTRRARKY